MSALFVVLSAAGGAAAAGVVFFLLHFSGRKNDEARRMQEREDFQSHATLRPGSRSTKIPSISPKAAWAGNTRAPAPAAMRGQTMRRRPPLRASVSAPSSHHRQSSRAEVRAR